ncbi:MAG: ABC transporter ATP-binding protein/permease [Gammaproteobacteria bacterium]|nr:ABC transporter ATP-binding protein/permease [Gammaproteobacteria bacterium]
MSRRIKYIRKPHNDRTDWKNLLRIFPYVWDYRGRVLVALLCLISAKLATITVPLVLKQVVDALDGNQVQVLVLPLTLLLAYGALRIASTAFNELRDTVFARVRYSAMHKLSARVLRHLHELSLRYHLERRTGGITRDLDRGARSISQILNRLVLTILPTIAEFVLVAALLFGQYPARFGIVVFITVVLYIGFTLMVTHWRMDLRHTMNRLDSIANAQAVDGLLNYETVKYFNNESWELERYNETMNAWEDVAVKTSTTMAMLNFGQGAIIAAGVSMIMIFAAEGVVQGDITLGDLVLVNALMLQLFLPLNFLGMMYRSLNYALADMDRILKLLERQPEIQDSSAAHDLRIDRAAVHFENVDFSYQAQRTILHEVSFEIPPGNRLAVVGPSGAGKSTLARLLFRFYDVTGGRVSIDGQDIRECSQLSLRRSIGIVPQDTVLFNESILYNIQYAKPSASREQVETAARMADIHQFIENLPQGYETIVGERGLKLSGGEKQRVAIARVILKRPHILVFDEATSNLDSRSEQAILRALRKVSAYTTTLVIAHRLSTIIDADKILVLDQGRIVERGRHSELLGQAGLYAHLWALQREERVLEESESMFLGG